MAGPIGQGYHVPPPAQDALQRGKPAPAGTGTADLGVVADFVTKDRRREIVEVRDHHAAVGTVRAARLLDKYGSVESVLTAGLEDLALVPGISRVVAERIRWAVSEPETRKPGAIAESE